MVQVEKEGCSASFRGYCGRNFFTNSNACYRRTASICLTIFIPLQHCDHYSFVLRPPLPAPITSRRPVRSTLFHFISILSAIFSRTREVCGNLQVQYYLETCLLMKNVTFHHCFMTGVSPPHKTDTSATILSYEIADNEKRIAKPTISVGFGTAMDRVGQVLPRST